MKWLVVLLLALVLGSKGYGELSQGSLRVLLICDTHGAKLKECYKADLLKMQHAMQEVAQHAGLRYAETVMHHDAITERSVHQWIRTLSDVSNDTVLIYYVGEKAPPDACKERNIPSRLTKGCDVQTKNKKERIQFYEIHKLLKKKNPRLALVLFDCYDRIVKTPKTKHTINTNNVKNGTTERYTLLFRKTRGIATVCSCFKYKHGYGIYNGNHAGGLLTDLFIEHLKSEKFPRGSWEDLCFKIKESTYMVSRRKQRPFYYHNVFWN